MTLYIIYSSVNFTWFAFVSHKKFNGRPLFMSGAMFDLLPFWIVSKQIFCKIKIIFAINQFQTKAKFTFMPKKSWLIERPSQFNIIFFFYWCLEIQLLCNSLSRSNMVSNWLSFLSLLLNKSPHFLMMK